MWRIIVIDDSIGNLGEFGAISNRIRNSRIEPETSAMSEMVTAEHRDLRNNCECVPACTKVTESR
jgi:hypothetical protein